MLLHQWGLLKTVLPSPRYFSTIVRGANYHQANVKMAERNQNESMTKQEQEELIKSKVDPTCIFCKIIRGEIPCFKIYESATTLAFFDINPISPGHALVIPKYHGQKLHDLPDFALNELLPVAKSIAIELGLVDYNILQNNGRAAHQEVDHVHFHIIPKPSASDSEGLVIGWPSKKADMNLLGQKAKEIKEKLDSKIRSSNL